MVGAMEERNLTTAIHLNKQVATAPGFPWIPISVATPVFSLWIRVQFKYKVCCKFKAVEWGTGNQKYCLLKEAHSTVLVLPKVEGRIYLNTYFYWFLKINFHCNIKISILSTFMLLTKCRLNFSPALLNFAKKLKVFSLKNSNSSALSFLRVC